MMKHRISFLLAVILATVLCLSGYAYAEQNDTTAVLSDDTVQKAIEMAEQFALEYETASMTLSMPEFSYIQRTDGTALLLEKLRYSIEFARSFNTGIENLQQISFNVLEMEEKRGGLFLKVYASFQYHHTDAPADMLSKHGTDYEILFDFTGESPIIVSLGTQSNDFNYFDELISQTTSSKSLSYAEAAKCVANQKISELPVTLEKWNEQVALFDNKYTQTDWESEISEDTTEALRSTSVSFSRSAAVDYATTFGDKYQNYIFKRMDADCTNFVSQCLWAGYGGTSGYSLSNTEALKARVAANYRQTSDWYGRNYDSSSQYAAGPFMRVVELWSHATGNTGNGPRATGYNNNNVWTSLSVVPRTGDVLQFYSSSKNRYNHSVIVSSTNNPSLSNMLDRIWVCQHSGDYVNRPLRATLEDNGGISSGKMRLMRPSSTTFSS
jgi:hypothetical protein